MPVSYDVIVVGAGSAGAVLAVRLSEDPHTSVLILEAGPDHRAADAPAGLRSANFFRAVSEPGRIWPDLVAARATGQQEALYLRGRGLGGSSSVNAMVAIRGTVDDYERWGGELGCPGWGWAEMLAAFLRVEDDRDYGGDGVHGAGGPMPLSRLALGQMPPLDGALRRAMGDLGYGLADDYHAPGASGVSRVALTLRESRRVSASDAYLEPARVRANLEVRGDVLVDRVLLEGRRAAGVRTATGEEIEAGEVIVCAGAIHSPAILLRSGIGLHDGLAVGANLKEHAAAPGFEIALKPPGRMPAPDAPVFSSMLRYSSGLAAAGPNDMQMIWFGAIGAAEEALAGGRLIGAVMRVFSRGEVRLRSQDPGIDPVVDFNMLSDERDLVRLRDCVRRMISVVRHRAVSPISDGVLALATPIDDLDSDDVRRLGHAGPTQSQHQPDNARRCRPASDEDACARKSPPAPRPWTRSLGLTAQARVEQGSQAIRLVEVTGGCVRYCSPGQCLRLVTDRTLDKPHPSRPKALSHFRSLAPLTPGESRG